MTGDHRDINGHPTWVEDGGVVDGPPVLLLHGGLSESGAMAGIGEALAGRYRIVAFDRRGHGRTADTDAPFHYADMAAETVAVLEDVVGPDGGPTHLIGWSDGGIVALLVALERPDLVRSLVVIGTNYHHEGIDILALAGDGEPPEMIRDTYVALSPDGPDHFPVVMEKAFTLFTTEPTLTTDDLARITHPTLVLVGDDDVIAHDHTLSLYGALPNGQLAVVPAASHLVVVERAGIVTQLIAEFLDSNGEVATFMPVRRAGRESSAEAESES